MISVNDKYEALVMRYFAGQCSAEETLELLSWVAESEENRVYFKSLKDQNDIWALTDFDKAEAVDVEAALDTVNARIDAIEEMTRTNIVAMPWLRRNYKYVSGVAAALVVALFVGFLVTKPFDSAVTLAYNGSDIESAYILPDGTSVTFNGVGKLSYPKHFASTDRTADFEGVAYFDVAKDEARPFIIHCDNMDVEVLGTSFLIHADKAAGIYSVDLYTGKVQMTAYDKIGNVMSRIELIPGERGVWNNNENELKAMTYAEVKEDDLNTNHVLVFDNESLSKIVDALEHIYKVEIHIDESCASKKLTARFSDDESIDEVLETIALASEVTITKESEAYQIR